MIEAKAGKMEVTKRTDGALFEKAGILISSGPRNQLGHFHLTHEHDGRRYGLPAMDGGMPTSVGEQPGGPAHEYAATILFNIIKPGQMTGLSFFWLPGTDSNRRQSG
jgi:hypothetical protein